MNQNEEEHFKVTLTEKEVREILEVYLEKPLGNRKLTYFIVQNRTKIGATEPHLYIFEGILE